MGFEYERIYQKGKENVAADSLSRRNEELTVECSKMVASRPQFAFVDHLKTALLMDPELAPLIS